MIQVPMLAALTLGVTLAAADAGTSPTLRSRRSQAMTRAVVIKVGAASFRATLLDMPAASVFHRLLPLSMSMTELNGNEKFTRLPTSLPVAAATPASIRSGDLMLYGPSTVVLFYKAFRTTHTYTPIGRIDDPVGLEAALGTGDVTVSIEAAQ